MHVMSVGNVTREQGRHALNFHQAGFGRAAQEYEQAARDEFNFAVARATEMSRAELLAKWVPSKIKQNNPALLLKLLNWTE